MFKEKRLERILKAKKALEKREELLNSGQPIEDKKQISFSDHDARIMSKKGYCEYSYNVQLSVDKDNQIILGQRISQSANGLQEVEPALEAFKEATDGCPVDRMSLDNGYASGPNFDTLNPEKIDAYVATDRQEKSSNKALENTDRKFVKADFVYDDENDIFICQAEQRLITNPVSKAKRKSYRADKAICEECPFRSRCSGSKKGLFPNISG